MLYIFILSLAALICGYFTLQYFSLIRALDKVRRDIQDIQQDLSQNQILHLPIPDRHLGALLCSFNSALEEIRKERIMYEKRERETLDIIEQKAESMKQLVDAFYDYSRLNAGDYELRPEPVDISRELCESLTGNFKLLEQKQLKVTAGIPEHPVWVSGNSSALDRIFFNLLQNSGRYADTWLDIRIKEQPERITILFTNDTCLLSESNIPFLFDRFYMQDHSRSQGSTGLGLTIAKTLAEEMHGTLKVNVPENTAAYGNKTLTVCFELVLPSAVPYHTLSFLRIYIQRQLRRKY